MLLDRDYQPYIGQTSRRAGQRLQVALGRYATLHPDGDVMCFSHGGVTVYGLRHFLGDDLLRSIAPGVVEYGVPCGAITTLSCDRGHWHVDSIANLEHIPASDRTDHLVP